MRLLIITDTYPPDINGVANTLQRLAHGLADRGHAVEIVTTLAAEAAEHLPRQVVPSVPLPKYPGLRIGLSSSRHMRRVFEKFHPDVLYVATETPLGLASIRAASALKIPVVSGFHTNFHTYLADYHLPGLERLARMLLRRIHNRTARTLTPSMDTARMLQSWGIRSVGTLGRGVDTELFSPAQRSTELRHSWGVEDDTPVAMYVGRVAPEKNLELLFQAFKAFRQVHPGAACVVVGDGPRLKALQEEHPDCIFTGAKTGAELAQCYASGDVFLFPSMSETFGNVVLEAMSSSLVTVAYGYAAPQRVIRHLHNGLLAKLGDSADFLAQTQRAAQLWNHADLRAAARSSVACFGWTQIVDQFQRELVEAALAGSYGKN
jgi:glycosyltransferase involved in cell wall biosynthesis